MSKSEAPVESVNWHFMRCEIVNYSKIRKQCSLTIRLLPALENSHIRNSQVRILGNRGKRLIRNPHALSATCMPIKQCALDDSSVIGLAFIFRWCLVVFCYIILCYKLRVTKTLRAFTRVYPSIPECTRGLTQDARTLEMNTIIMTTFWGRIRTVVSV